MKIHLPSGVGVLAVQRHTDDIDRQNSTSQVVDWVPANSASLPCISSQDLKAMDALFENLDPESVECDLCAVKSAAIDAIEWDLVDLIA